MPLREGMITIVTATDARACRLRDSFHTVAMITARPLPNPLISVFHTAQCRALFSQIMVMLYTTLMVKDDNTVHSSQMINTMKANRSLNCSEANEWEHSELITTPLCATISVE